MAGEMRVDIYLPLYVRDFLTSTLGWSAEEKGHYLTLLMIQWDRDGLPAGLPDLERLSPGVAVVWPMLEGKFPACDDGQRRNERLEAHRGKAIELKGKRVEAGKRAAAAKAANVKQAFSNREASVEQSFSNRSATVKHPPPPPPPPSSLREEEIHTHRVREVSDDFGHPGWAAEEWDRFVAVWNQTERAAKWTPLMAPAGWADNVAYPEWIDRARQALGRLPNCKFFDRPLAVTKFFEFMDRILAGEFDNEKYAGKPRRPVESNF
ncbi:MAG: hypothetical protein WCG15_00030 [Actinomycetes bacterium]